MLFGGILFCAGALINGFAKHVWMLIVGRILLGFGIGFANQVSQKKNTIISPFHTYITSRKKSN